MRYIALVLLVVAGSVTAQSIPPGDAFYETIRTNDLAKLDALVRAHGVDSADGSGQTPLMLAAAFGSTDAVRRLIAAGANVAAQSGTSITALHLAVTDIEKTRLLVDAGADVNIATALGRTPLILAAASVGSIEVVRLLLSRGAAINGADNSGTTPLSQAALADNRDVAQLLLDRGARLSLPTSGPPTGIPLSAAAVSGNVALVKELLMKGADPNIASPDVGAKVKYGPITFARISPIHVGVASGDPGVVSALIAAGSNVNVQDMRGLTPLMIAIATDRPSSPVIAMLLEAGARLEIRDKQGQSASDWARKFENPIVLAALRIPAPSAAPVSATATARPPVGASARTAVDRALPLLRDVSANFLATGGCVACHAQPLTGMAVTLAHARGWASPIAEPEARIAAARLAGEAPPLLQLVDSGGLPDGIVYQTMQMAETKVPSSRTTDTLVRYLAAKQRPDGSWQGIGGTRAPIQDGRSSRTAMAIRTLAIYATPAVASTYRQRVTRAAAWLDAQVPTSTEDRVMQLLGLHWANAGASNRTARIAQLKSLQRADGGWGQTPYLPSDAYATGQVLYTLRQVGVPASDQALRRGAAFLVTSQAHDGSWHVKNRAMKLQPYFESGFPYEHDQWISHAGSAWAVMGLSLVGDDAPIGSTASDRAQPGSSASAPRIP